MKRIFVFDYEVPAFTRVYVKAESLEQAEAYLEDGIWNSDTDEPDRLNDMLEYGAPSITLKESTIFSDEDYYEFDATNSGIDINGNVD